MKTDILYNIPGWLPWSGTWTKDPASFPSNMKVMFVGYVMVFARMKNVYTAEPDHCSITKPKQLAKKKTQVPVKFICIALNPSPSGWDVESCQVPSNAKFLSG